MVGGKKTTNLVCRQLVLGNDELPFELPAHHTQHTLSDLRKCEPLPAFRTAWEHLSQFRVLKQVMCRSSTHASLFITSLNCTNILQAANWISRYGTCVGGATLQVFVDCRMITTNYDALDAVVFAFRNAVDSAVGNIPSYYIDVSDSDENDGDDGDCDVDLSFDIQYRSVRLATIAIRESIQTFETYGDATNPIPGRVNVTFQHAEVLSYLTAASLSPTIVSWLFSLHASTTASGSKTIINTIFISSRLPGRMFNNIMPYTLAFKPLILNWPTFSRSECVDILGQDIKNLNRLGDDVQSLSKPPRQHSDGVVSLVVETCFDEVKNMQDLLDVYRHVVSFPPTSTHSRTAEKERKKATVKHAGEYASLITNASRVYYGASILPLHSDLSTKSTTTSALLPSVVDHCDAVRLRAQMYRYTCTTMPLLTRWTIIAAFLAANNPERADQILCATTHDRVGRRDRFIRDRAKLATTSDDRIWNEKAGGGAAGKPLRISLQRIHKLLNYLLNKEDVKQLPDDMLCHSAVATLVEQNLLCPIVRPAAGETTNNPQAVALGVNKYFCLISNILVLEVAKSLNFKLVDHLYDESAIRLQR